MAPNFHVHAAAAPPSPNNVDSRVGAVLLGPPGSGKGTVVNIFFVSALYL